MKIDTKQEKALKKSGLFQGIADEEYKSLINCISPQIKHFSKNEIMILTGDKVNHIGVILNGTASAYLEHIDGSRTIMSNLSPMSVFGEIIVSTRTHKSPVTVYALTDVTAAFIEYRKVYSMCAAACASHSIFLENMLMAVGDKYFLLFDRIAILREKTLRSRILAYLIALSDRMESDTVMLPFSKTMLADYLLANRSALSKELRKMENDGLIKVNGREVKLFRSWSYWSESNRQPDHYE